jgi:RNA polymerase sigma factor (sigma-70 family)
MNGDADLRLLQDCLTGKAEAWDAFLARFGSLLGEACRRALRRRGRPAGPQEVADMLQVTCLTLLKDDMKALRGYSGRGSVAGYLSTVAVCRCLDDRTLEPAGKGSPASRPDPAPGPSGLLEAQETLEGLRRELAGLAPRERLALALQSQGASLQEIGGILRLSPAAAGQLVSRARSRLRERLDAPG